MHLTPDEWLLLRENNRKKKLEAERRKHEKKYRHLAENGKRGPGGPGSKLWQEPT